MANTTTIKRRINSIKNTRQITKAMELVASSKLRRAQNQAEMTRNYRQAAYRLLARLSRVREVEQQPLFKKRTIKTKLYILISSNSGLAGAYNSNVFKKLTSALEQDKAKGVKSRVITIGSKGVQLVRQLKGVELEAHYPNFGDEPTENDIRPILDYIVDGYAEAKIDSVHLIYTVFKSSITQEATNLALLPAHLEPRASDQIKPIDDDKLPEIDMNFEPDVETVVHHVTARLIESQIWQALLESLASEYAMRMMAMKNATDNANDLIDDYTLEYNTARQAAITQELAEITGGAEALSET
ncbi:MAG TPA: ATP synthase F1 subunit gamma [Candidatus Saccharimonadales bacterium]|nr:ATP synthase F1 subunit gamma [Candidatus Saccharimonadales bacterium]